MRMPDGTSKKYFGLTLEERIDLYTSPEPNSGCWLWMGGMRNGVNTPDIKHTMNGKVTSVLVRRFNRSRFIGDSLDGVRVIQTCRVTECVNPFHQKLGHYDGASTPPKLGRTPQKSVYERIDEQIEPEPNSGCWLWSGHAPNGRYGKTSFGRKFEMVHRLQYIRYHGPIPEGMVVRHKCDVSLCVNPSHLEIGTHQDNMQDMVKRGRCRNPKGEQHHNAVLTSEKVRAIRFMYQSGEFTKMSLSRMFEVSIGAITGVVTNETWREENE